MPTYQYYCKSCYDHKDIASTVDKRDKQHCPLCANPLKREFSIRNLATGLGYAGWYTEMDTTPVYITSKSHLKEECLKRNVMAHSLLT